MQRSFQAAPGVSLLQRTLQNGAPIRGITIDNPTGSWLLIKGENVFVPPYTIGWAMPTTYNYASVDVTAEAAGPAGQVSTNKGTNWELTLFDTPQAPSAGVPYQFIEGFTGILTASSGSVYVGVSFGGAVPTTLINVAAIPNQRFRVKTMLVNRTDGDHPVFLFGNVPVPSMMNPIKSAFLSWPEGFDLATNTAILIQGGTPNDTGAEVWSPGYWVSVDMTYQVI